MTHTSLSSEPYEDKCQCEPLSSVPYLDTLCSIEEGRIEIDLFKKKTDRNQYLLPSSCHVKSVVRNIPFSLALRIVRICTKPEQRDLRLNELKELLLERNYSPKSVDCSIARARAIPRKVALRKSKINQASKGPIFALHFDPRLPPIQNMQAKHWRSMTSQNKYLAEVFPRPPLTAFKRQANIRNILIRAKVAGPPRVHKERMLKGMTKCGKACTACPFIQPTKSIKIDKKNKWNINRKVSCNSYNVIYMISCNKHNCKEKRYIGETGRILKYRLAEHRGYVTNNVTSQATGAHFNLPGHSLANMNVVVLEQVKKRDQDYRKERERYLIQKFNTYNEGMNQQV